MSLWNSERCLYNHFMRHATAIVNGYVLLPGLENFYLRMKEELSYLGFDLRLRKTTELLSWINEEGEIVGDESLGEFILFLDKDLYLSHLLEKRGYRLFNSAEAIRLCDDKMLTNIALSNHGIKMPKTYGAPLNYFNGDNEAYLSQIESVLPYPFVAKASFGSMGNGVFLIKNRSDLDEFSKKHANSATIFQEFIASSSGKDYRVIVIDKKVVAAMKRENKNDFRSNIARGGKGTPATLDNDFKEVAERCAAILDCDYCGVDLLIGPSKEPIVCEVNSNAFIAGIERATGINIAKAYAEYIAQSLK